MLLGRNKIVKQALLAGYHVLIADIDQVWLDNPLSHFKRVDSIMVKKKLEFLILGIDFFILLFL